MAVTFVCWAFALSLLHFSTASVLSPRQSSTASSTSSSASSTPTTFYIVDNTVGENDNGYKADATTAAPYTYFGVGWDGATLFKLDGTLLMSADPDVEEWSAYIVAGGDGEVEFGLDPNDAEPVYLSCSIVDDALSCSADGGYDQLILDGSAPDADDFRLRLVQSNTTSKYAYTATLGPQYAAAVTPAPETDRFWLETQQGWAVWNPVNNTAIHAGEDYGKDGEISIWSIDNSTGYLTTASGTTSDNPDPMVSFINGSASGGYSLVEMATLPLTDNSSIPLVCQLATDGSQELSCTAGAFTVLWLDLGISTDFDYKLYMGTSNSTGLGTSREVATINSVTCATCTGS